MLNQTIIVGKLSQKPSITMNGAGKEICELTFEVERNYKNIEGNYDTDFVTIQFNAPITELEKNRLIVGTLIGVKGRIETFQYVGKDDALKTACRVIGEKLSFISPE